MALTFLYRDLDATDTDITPYVVLRFNENPQGMAENAEERSVGAWELQIEDDGALDLHAQRTFYVLEDDTYDGDPVLWVGQTFDKHSERGAIHRTGPGRVYTLSLIDLNTVLERKVIHGSHDQDRPAETDVERMLWLESEGLITGGTDWISTASPVNMDAADYDGRMVAEVIEDCCNQSTKNCFEFRDPDDGGFKTFYGDSSADVDVLTSDIRISNVLSDIDNVTTWETLLDADLWEANSRIYSGMFANYDGGSVYVENSSTVTNFSHRDTVVSWPDVKSSTRATERATRQLAIIGSEEYRITCAIEVDSDQVGFMPHAGWRLQARFSHYPFFTDFTWMRILNRNTTLIGPNRYRVQYELSPGPAAAPPVACASVIASMQTDDSGMIDSGCNGSGDFGPGTAWTPDNIASGTGVVVGVMGFANQSGGYGTPPVTVSGFTMMNSSRDGPCSYPFGFSTHAVSAYKAGVSGSPGAMGVSWGSGGTVYSYRGLALYIPTSATSPANTGTVCQSGSTATMSGTPTPGNLLVACFFSETQGHAPPDPPSGWTTQVSGSFSGGQIACVPQINMYLYIYTRCVIEGDTDEIDVGNANFSHWAFVSEWELT